MRSAARAFAIGSLSIAVALVTGCGGSSSDSSGAGPHEQPRETARFTMMELEGEAATPVGTGSIDMDAGLLELRYAGPPAGTPTAPAAQEASDDVGETTVLYDLRAGTLYSDLEVLKKLGLGDAVKDKQWIRTRVDEIADQFPRTEIFFNPYGFEAMRTESKRARRVGSERIDGDLMAKWELVIEMTAKFLGEPPETETVTFTAWVGADDHLIHRLRSDEPGHGDTPASSGVMDFTDFGEPVDLHRPNPSTVIDDSSLGAFGFTTTDGTDTEFGTSWITTDANGAPVEPLR